MPTSYTTTSGDYEYTVEGEPTWDNPIEWMRTSWAWRAGSEPANRELLLQRAGQAIDDNRAYLAKESPTTAEALAQVKALTRQMNGVLRLMVQRLDAVE